MDLGTIGLSIETKGDDIAVRGLENYLAALRRTMSELRASVREQEQFASIRESINSREIRDNMSLWKAVQSLNSQKMRALQDEVRQAERAAQEIAAAEQRKYREAERTSEAITSLARQRESALDQEVRKAQQAAEAVAAAERSKFREAERTSDAITALARQRESALEQEVRKARQTAEAVAAAEKLKYREAERTSDAMASIARQREAALQDEIQATRLVENQYKSLAASLDPVVRAQQRFDASTDILNRALYKGVITIDQQRAALESLRAQMMLAGIAVNQYGVVMDGTNRSMIRASRDGVQQLGYQVGDLAVQLQSGTSFLVAFAQQGSQVLQIFGPGGAIAGAVLAVVAALGTVFLNTSSFAENLDDSLRGLEDSMDRVNTSMDLLNDDELSFRFGNLTDDVRSLASSMVLLDEASALKNLKSTLATLEESIDPSYFQLAMRAMAMGGSALGAGPGAVAFREPVNFEGIEEENFRKLGLSLGYETWTGLTEGIDAAAAMGDTEAVTRGIKELYTQAIPDAEAAAAAVAAGGDTLVRAYSAAAIATAEMAANQNGTAAAARESAEAAELEADERERIAIAAERALETYQRSLATGIGIWDNLQNELDLQEAINAYGEESIKVREVRNRQEADALELRLQQLYATEGISEEEQVIIDNAIQLLGELQAARDAADDTARAADRISSGLTGAVNQAMQLRNALAEAGSAALARVDRIAVLQAQISAAERGTSVEGAAAGAETAIGLGRAGASIDEIARRSMEASALAQQEAALRDQLGELTKPADKAGGGGGGDVEDGLRDAQRAFESTRTEAEKYAIEVDRINELHQLFPEIVTDDVVNRALKQLQDGLDQTAQVAKRLEEAFSQTATSIVMGSETAGEAVSNLLKMLAEMAIQAAFSGLFKGLFGPISWLFTPGALPSANGNVFSGGNMVPFQDGGVVSGTTFFPMGGGNTGMMGEAGPEAVMPLRRDARGRLGVDSGSEPQKIVLEVRAEEGEMFVPRIRQISGNVAVQVTGSSMRAQSTAFGATITDYDQRGTS